MIVAIVRGGRTRKAEGQFAGLSGAAEHTAVVNRCPWRLSMSTFPATGIWRSVPIRQRQFCLLNEEDTAQWCHTNRLPLKLTLFI